MTNPIFPPRNAFLWVSEKLRYLKKFGRRREFTSVTTRRWNVVNCHKFLIRQQRHFFLTLFFGLPFYDRNIVNIRPLLSVSNFISKFPIRLKQACLLRYTNVVSIFSEITGVPRDIQGIRHLFLGSNFTGFFKLLLWTKIFFIPIVQSMPAKLGCQVSY